MPAEGRTTRLRQQLNNIADDSEPTRSLLHTGGVGEVKKKVSHVVSNEKHVDNKPKSALTKFLFDFPPPPSVCVCVTTCLLLRVYVSILFN